MDDTFNLYFMFKNQSVKIEDRHSLGFSFGEHRPVMATEIKSFTLMNTYYGKITDLMRHLRIAITDKVFD